MVHPTSGWRGLTGSERWRLAGGVGSATLFRYACFAVMVWLTLLAESRPAPGRLPDLVLEHVPYVAFVDRWNYHLWLACYIPLGAVLLGLDPRRFIRFMVTGGVLSVVRGVCILLTGLGPVHLPDANPARLAEPGVTTRAFFEIVDPTGVFFRDSAHIYLTKDLFFSGHVATTFLLLLYVWPYRRLRRAMFVLHAIVVASVFLSHLHYTIDVVGAWAIAFALFVLREGRPGAILRGSAPT
ncbi:MAG: phosphatase PAP2-related protein [Planctomycetota bacterium]|jgi:hypothetical protein